MTLFIFEVTSVWSLVWVWVGLALGNLFKSSERIRKEQIVKSLFARCAAEYGGALGVAPALKFGPAFSS